MSDLQARRANGETVSHTTATPGYAIVVEREPVLLMSHAQSPVLTLFGLPGRNYAFLIRFFAKVREQLLAEADAAYAKFKAELEKKKMPAAKRAKLLNEKWQQVQRDLEPKNTQSRLWELSNRCVYGTDANDRMARTSKMNMIMHGDGHGGVHHWNGFLNVNGIFDARFNLILTNPPFGAHVESSALVEVPEGREWDETKRRYGREYGDHYRGAVARVEAAKGKPIASLFELPKRGNGDKPASKLGKIKTELLFIERCLDLLQPSGRLGIVLPEGVFNNPSLAYVREFVEDRAFLRAVISLPPETFFSSGASVKASILFLQKFSDKEQKKFDKLKAEARVEIEEKYANEITKETERLEGAIEAAKTAGDKDARKEREKELNESRRAMAEKMATESRVLLKQRFNYPVFLYEAEHVGITATGEPDVNELYPNDRQPPGGAKTCVELYREFRKNPSPFLATKPDETTRTPTELTLLPPTPQRGAFALPWSDLERWDTFFYRKDFLKLDWDLDRVPHLPLGEILQFESRGWKPKDFPDGKFRYIEIGAVTKEDGIRAAQVVEVANAPSRATTRVRAGDVILSTTPLSWSFCHRAP